MAYTTSRRTTGPAGGNGPTRKVGPAPRMSATTRSNREASRARGETARIAKAPNMTR
jgi:hypothetical protein